MQNCNYRIFWFNSNDKSGRKRKCWEQLFSWNAENILSPFGAQLVPMLTLCD